jgi:hypothetical protein
MDPDSRGLKLTDPDPEKTLAVCIGCELLAQSVHQGGDVGQPRPHTECRLQREDGLLRPLTGQIAHTYLVKNFARQRHGKRPVLRIQDVYPGSKFFHSGFRVEKIPDPDPQQRIYVAHKSVTITYLALRNMRFSFLIPYSDLFHLGTLDPNPGVKKVPGSGSAILQDSYGGTIMLLARLLVPNSNLCGWHYLWGIRIPVVN